MTPKYLISSSKSFLLKNVCYVFLVLLFTYPILPSAIQSILIGSFTILCFVYNRLLFQNNWKNISWKYLLINNGWYFLLCLTIIYSSDKGKGIDYLVRGISLFILPFIFIYFLPKVSKKQKQILFFCFIIIHVFIIFFIYSTIIDGIDSIGYFTKNGDRIKGIASTSWSNQFSIFIKMPFSVSRFYLNENEITKIFIHKAYLSMGYVWCILLMTYIIIREHVSKYIKLILFFLIGLFALVVVYFTSIPNILSLLILFPLFTFFLLKKRKSRIIFLLISMLTIVVFTQTSFAKEKIFKDKRLVSGVIESKQLLKSVFTNIKTDGSNIRIEVWKCSYARIKERFLWGYGLGSEETVLSQCYDKNGCSLCLKHTFNSHNQYASFLISGGILVLFLFIFSIIYCFNIAFKMRNYLYLFFLILFVINLLSESMLIRIHGILFYTLFNSLFFADVLKEKFIPSKDDLVC